ncbi:MAG: helix-turn-helix domain-containing protein [Chitinophagaceae bacterium]
MELTFEQLPTAVSRLYTKLENIERLLELKSQPEQHSDRWYDINEICDYMPEKPAKATVYGWVHSSVIPHHKKGKKLYFLKSEIDVWLRTGRRKTLAELNNEADGYLETAKRR